MLKDVGAPYFVPIHDLLPYWPHDLLALNDVAVLGRLGQVLGVTDFELVKYEGEVSAVGTLALGDELAFDLPLVDGVELVVGQAGIDLTAVPFELDFGPPSEEVTVDFDETASDLAELALDTFLKGRQGPYELVLPEVDIGLRFDPDDLRPMRPKVAADLSKGFEPDPTKIATQLNFRAAVAISTDTGLRLEAPGDLDLPYCQIGSTGIVISAQDLVFRLSDEQPFPEGIEPAAFDLDPDWKGVYLGRVQVFNLNTLVDGLPERIDLEKWFLGRGGVTGKATAILDLEPDMSAQSFAVRSFRLAFQQSVLVEGLVQMSVKLSYFDDRVVYLDLAITNEPTLDFPESVGFMGSIAGRQPAQQGEAPRQDELLTLTVEDKLRVGATKLGVSAAPDRGRAGSDFPPETRFWDLHIDGRVEIGPGATVADALFGGEFKDLVLQFAPRFEFILPSGLWLALNEAARTKLSAFPISISRIGFGSQGAEDWIGLDAAVDLGSGIGAAASVKGLRVYYGGPPGTHLAFDGLALEVQREGFEFYGFVSMVAGADPDGIADPADRTFRGDVTLAAKDLGVKLEGSVLFGTKGGTRFGYVGLDAEFGSGIPIFSSVSLFGAALLAGVNVRPDKTLAGNLGDDFNWYQHWYATAPAPYSVLNARKWVPVQDGWAVGAGAMIGSSDGKAWSLRALLAIVAPGPLVIVEGRLAILKTREPHTGPPRATTIRGLMVLDFDQGDFLLALEVDYKLPQSGLLLDVHAAGEVFYGHRPGDWHLAIGWPEPVSRRVRAKALKLLEWDAYLVISGSDLELAERTFPGTALAVGYRTGIDKRGKWGPVKGVLAVWIAGDVALSFSPFYILAELSLHGEASVKVWGFGFELMLDALIALEAPVGDDDEFFGGKVQIKLGLPWPLPDIKKSIPFDWGDASGMPPPITPLVDVASVSPGYTVVGERFYERETATVTSVSMPLDGRVTITFQRPMRSTWAGAPTPVDLANPDRVGDFYYRYTVEQVRVHVTPSAGSLHDASEDLFGQWTLGPGDATGPQAESLVLWGLTPFPAAGNLAWPGRTERRSWADLPFETYPRWPCGTVQPTQRCVDFDLVPLGVKKPSLDYRPDPAYGAVEFTPWPSASRGDEVEGQIGEFVQVPLAIIDSGGNDARQHVLRLSRTTFLGGRDGQDTTAGPVDDGVTLSGVGIDLPRSVHAVGRVDHDKDLTFVVVEASMDGTVVGTVVADGPDFEIASNDKPFNRVIVRVHPRGAADRGRGRFHTLSKFCYTSVGAVANDDEAQAQRLRWIHVLGPLIIDQPETNDDRFGAHLVHEPHAAYRIEVDVHTESAEALDDPWTDHGTETEVLTVSTGGAPADLSPYVASVAPGDGARPFYADYDLRVTYNQPYVEAMYQKAGGLLVADLFTAGGEHVEPEVIRGRSVTPAITAETSILVDALQAAECVAADPDAIVGFDETTYRTQLATSTAYEVRVTGGGLPAPVYRWSFVTSRYHTFSEHFGDMRRVPWHERLPPTVDWGAIAHRLAPVADRGTEDENWRGIWQTVLGYPIRTLPERPEVTILWSEPSAFEARALSIVGPEPLFATDRTGLALKRRTVQLILSPLGPRTIVTWRVVAHRLVRSLDGTRTLLVAVDPAGQPVRLAAGSYRLEATYRLTGVADLPDLSRQGVDSDELATWTFSVPVTPAPIVDPEA